MSVVGLLFVIVLGDGCSGDSSIVAVAHVVGCVVGHDEEVSKWVGGVEVLCFGVRGRLCLIDVESSLLFDGGTVRKKFTSGEILKAFLYYGNSDTPCQPSDPLPCDPEGEQR